MKKNIFLLICLFALNNFLQAQSTIPIADLLDLKFTTGGKALDISTKNMNVIAGSGKVSTTYDANIKQYVSHYPQNTTYKNFFKVSYKDNADFRNKIQQSFAIELYAKFTNDKFMTPVGSMESGGFGIQQEANGGVTQLNFGKNSGDYHKIGSKSVYDKIKHEYCHIVFTYDGNNLKSYYNGVQSDNLPNVGKLKLSSNTAAHWIAIGGDVVGASEMNRRFIGDIAMVRMYSNVLSSAQIAELYKQIESRKSMSNTDMLNKLLTKTLTEISGSKSEQYQKEGWRLMQSMNTTELDITNYASKVATEFGITLPKISSYPRFAVLSDIHVGCSKGWSPYDGVQLTRDWKRQVGLAVNTLKQNIDDYDAVFVVGDVSDHGKSYELKDAMDILSPISAQVPIYYMMGNHDWHEGDRSVFQSVIGQPINQFIEIKGYPFLTISLDGKEQRDSYKAISQTFAKEALARAAKEYPDKPIFVYMHVPLINTVYGSYAIAPGTLNRATFTESMKEICSKYPQIILFTGHSHRSIADEKSIHQEKFTAVHDGNVSFGTMEDGIPGWYFPFGHLDLLEGLFVSVEQNKDVKVKKMNYFKNEEIKTPWIIKAPHNGSMFTYTNKRKDLDIPHFKSDDKIAITNISNNSFTVTFPQAKNENGIHHYWLDVIDKDNPNGSPVYQAPILSRFHMASDMPDSLSWVVKDLRKHYSNYEVQITAVNAFYPNNKGYNTNESDPPLVGSVKLMPYEKIYLTGSAAPCNWTNTNPEVLLPEEGTEGILIWKGHLNKGEFKFLLTKGAWNPSINPTSQQNVTPGTSYKLNMTNGSSGDYKFLINRSMNCTIRFNTKDWTMTVTEDSTVSDVYLTGTAMPCGWTANNPEVMLAKDDVEGIFTWTGHLTKGEFKFLLSKGSWDPSVNPKLSQNIASNTLYEVAITNGTTNDYKFSVNRDMYCTIALNTKDWTVVVTEDFSKLSLYVIGNSTPAGWNNHSAMAMQEEGGIFTWEGYLTPGHLKFITELGTWKSVIPSNNSNEYIITGYKHLVTDKNHGDYRFIVPENGYYTIWVNMNDNTMTVSKFPDDTPLYIIGAATPTGWYNNRAMPMTKVSESIYKWTGTLKADQFKFITKLGTWRSIMPATKYNMSVSIGTQYPITNIYYGDYRFVMSQRGDYTVTVDLANKSLLVENALAEDYQKYSQVLLPDNKYVYIKILAGSVEITTNIDVDQARLTNMSGVIVDTQKGVTGVLHLGKNLMTGVYIIELISNNGERSVKKVMIP